MNSQPSALPDPAVEPEDSIPDLLRQIRDELRWRRERDMADQADIARMIAEVCGYRQELAGMNRVSVAEGVMYPMNSSVPLTFRSAT